MRIAPKSYRGCYIPYHHGIFFQENTSFLQTEHSHIVANGNSRMVLENLAETGFADIKVGGDIVKMDGLQVMGRNIGDGIHNGAVARFDFGCFVCLAIVQFPCHSKQEFF